jgi:hypothetical protein
MYTITWLCPLVAGRNAGGFELTTITTPSMEAMISLTLSLDRRYARMIRVWRGGRMVSRR